MASNRFPSWEEALVSEENSNFVAQIAIYDDRGNEFMTPVRIIITLKQLELGFNQTQAKNHYHKISLPKHKGKLNSRAGKAYKTTPKRSLCEVDQQHR